MEHAHSPHSIEEQLGHALQQFAALPGAGGPAIGIPVDRLAFKKAVERLLDRRNEWLADVPAMQGLQDWVETHWDPERQPQPPAGTVSAGTEWVDRGEVQLDALSAACKLLLAAVVYGVDTVAKHAMEFAAHGMIEVRYIYLMKGPSVSNARSLDDYCTLLPYPEVMDIDSSDQLPPGGIQWPPVNTDNVCALDVRSFERRGVVAADHQRRESPLLQCGTEVLTLILGLVWRRGYRVFGGWRGVSEPVAATLPFTNTTASRGRWTSQTLLTMPGFTQPSPIRPLNRAELRELIRRYADLAEQSRNALNLAMRRLRDSTERIEFEDKVIDVCIALEAMFMEDGEEHDHKVITSRRGSWYFADSYEEREQTRALLKEFYDYRNSIAHGNAPENLTPEERELHVTQLADVENVVRASLKTMIYEGRPPDWEKSKDFKAIRQDPPRAETEIPSVKSDSLSWTVAEQNEIDQALEAMWKPTVDNAPPPPPDAVSVSHQGVNAEEIKRCRQEGIPYVISVPIRLYMAHPRWPQQEGDPLDDRTTYYCEKDVEKHLRRWQKAAAAKKIHQFELPLEDPTMYLPKAFDMWRKILQQGEPP